MQVNQYVSEQDIAVTLQDSIEDVLLKMNDLYYRELPVVDKGDYVGLIREDLLLDAEDSLLNLASLKYHIHAISIFNDQHGYDAIQIMAQNKIEILPIIDRQNTFIGTLTQKNLIHALQQHMTQQEGAIIVLELAPMDYSLAQIARIIELEDALIVHQNVRFDSTSEKFELTLQLNIKHISAVISSFNRHGYTVVSTYKQAGDYIDLQNRYSHLMNYLDI